MELLETQDPEKRKLIETSERHRHELERELKDISDRGEKTLKNALIIGGVLAVTYFAFTQFSSRKKKKKAAKATSAAAPAATSTSAAIQEDDEDDTPSLASAVGDRLLNVATVFLVDLAKEKLSDFLKNKKVPDDDTREFNRTK